ncbi:MAG TPA: hypothetical protein VLI65_08015, partial [Pyrinomonadaceae bacterium]|nr:hypothetical protein [Pyrinomonadaceae bacterium]
MIRVLLSLFTLMSVAVPTFAIDMSREIEAAAAKELPKVIEWRRHIHQYPELSNREVKTAKFVEDNLRGFGIEVRTRIAKTGVVGILK